MKNSPPRFTRQTHPRETGIALVTVLIMLVLVATLVSVTSLLALGNRRSSADTVASNRALYAAEAGIEAAIQKVYHDPFNNWQHSTDYATDSTGTTIGTARVKNSNNEVSEFDNCAYKKWLTGVFPDTVVAGAPVAAAVTARTNNGNLGCNYVYAQAAVTSYPFSDLSTPAQLLNGSIVNFTEIIDGTTSSVGGQAVADMTVTRTDDASGGMTINVSSTGKVKNSTSILAQKTVQRSVSIGGDNFDGDKFAMLTNSTNCAFCHLQVDTMKRAYSDTGSSERVLLGAVSNDLPIKLDDGSHNADSLVYGTIFSRQDREPLYADGDTQHVAWTSGKDGYIDTGTNNSQTKTSFSTSNAVNAKGSGTIPKNAKLYYNYPTKAEVNDPAGNFKGKWPDAVLPDGFPAVVPDGGDGTISDTDWENFWPNQPSGALLTTSAARIYGVRRPSTKSTRVNTDIPITYDPVTANGITGTQPDTVTANTIDPAALTNPTNYRGWWIRQALASPNNRDFKPTNPTAATAFTSGSFRPIDLTRVRGALQNNFYVNFTPNVTVSGTSGQLSLAYCNATGVTSTTNIDNFCYRTGVDTGNPAPSTTVAANPTSPFDSGQLGTTGASDISSVTVALRDSDIFPQTSNSASQDLSLEASTQVRYGPRDGYFDGNLIIDAGRLDDTSKILDISGSIYVNGDLVIRGLVRGQGRIVARGNIYVVGDLVYACQTSGTPRVCARADYASPTNLPKLAMLAGGNIVVSNYDQPDTRLEDSVTGSHRAFDLTNDQAARSVRASAAIPGPYWNIPGSTGSSDVVSTYKCKSGSDFGMGGFLTRVMQEINGRNFMKSRKSLYKLNPFGLMLGFYNSGTDDASKLEDAGHCLERSNNSFFIDPNANSTTSRSSANFSFTTLYPSNGPMKIGSALGNLDNGLATYAASLGGSNFTNLGCIRSVDVTNTTAQGVAAPTGFTANRAIPNLATQRNSQYRPANTAITATNLPYHSQMTFGYYCTPAANGQYVRTSLASSTVSDPSQDTSAWQAQSTLTQGSTTVAAPDAGSGLTTGWLGGILNPGSATNAQLGDLSQTRLLKMMWLTTMESGTRTTQALRTDGIFYSANTIATVLRKNRDRRSDAASSTGARWIHNGSVIAADLGFLLTGDSNTRGYNSQIDPAGTSGPAFGIFYDERLVGLLQLANGNKVNLRRFGGYAQKVSR
jgi:hypothetical protein